LCLFLARHELCFVETWGKFPGKMVCMETIASSEYVSDLRYALEVMEESSHLGLDDEHARLLHDILKRRIDEGCTAFSVKPASPMRIPVSCKTSA
jgi:hypothetical protein